MACFWGLVAVECVLLDLWFCDCLASELQAERARMRNKNRAFLARVMAIVVQIWVAGYWVSWSLVLMMDTPMPTSKPVTTSEG